MYRIQQITNNSLQNNTLVLPDGSSLTLQIYFRPMQYGWFINELTYGSFILRGVRITNNPNMLRQFKNKLPFGLACYSIQNREPSLQDDFSSGASKLYILSAIEVQQYEQLIAGVPFWVSTISYPVGTLTNYQGIIYVSLVEPNVGHNPATSPTYWGVYE